MKEGERVIALLSSDSSKKETILFGEGIYLGDIVPNEEKHGSFFGNSTLEFLSKSNIPNPVIKLDDGTHVFGCECWWGPKDLFQKKLDHMVENGWNISVISKVDLYKIEEEK